MDFVKLQLVAKYEKKLKGALGRFQNISAKKIKMRFLNSVTVPKNLKDGTLWNFLISIVLQNFETNEVETLWWNPKNFKKSHSAEKNPSEKKTKGRGDPMFLRFWTLMFLFWTRFWRFECFGRP